MFCSECGNQIPENAMFCGRCGKKVMRGNSKRIGFSREIPGSDLPALKEGSDVGRAFGGKGVWIVSAVILAVIVGGVIYLFQNSEVTGKIFSNSAIEESSDAPVKRSDQRVRGTLADSVTQESVETKAGENNATDIDRMAEDAESVQGIVDLNDARQLEIAMALSSGENAGIMDVDRFYLYMDEGSEEKNRMMQEWVRLTDMPLLLSGGWRAYMCDKHDFYGGAAERYLNVWIDTDGDMFKITLNWKYLRDKESGETTEETGSDSFTGVWDPLTGTAVLTADFGSIRMDDFYIKPYRESFGIGRMEWISGEEEYIVLFR